MWHVQSLYHNFFSQITQCLQRVKGNIGKKWVKHVRHWVKSVHIRNFPGLYFPAFELNTERCGDIRTRKTPNTDIFQAVRSIDFKIILIIRTVETFRDIVNPPTVIHLQASYGYTFSFVIQWKLLSVDKK